MNNSNNSDYSFVSNISLTLAVHKILILENSDIHPSLKLPMRPAKSEIVFRIQNQVFLLEL